MNTSINEIHNEYNHYRADGLKVVEHIEKIEKESGLKYKEMCAINFFGKSYLTSDYFHFDKHGSIIHHIIDPIMNYLGIVGPGEKEIEMSHVEYEHMFFAGGDFFDRKIAMCCELIDSSLREWCSVDLIFCPGKYEIMIDKKKIGDMNDFIKFLNEKDTP